MKTLNYFLFVALSLFTLFSCGKEGQINSAIIEPEVEPEVDQAAQALSSKDLIIYNSPCFAGGETLIVYHAADQRLDYFDNDRFQVEWFANGKKLHTGTILDCTCGNLRVEVTDLETKTVAAKNIEAGVCVINNDQKL